MMHDREKSDPALGSADSAAGCPALFVGFTAALASRNLVHHSGPGRLARPYPVEDLHLLSFASIPGALAVGSFASAPGDRQGVEGASPLR